MRRCEGWRSYLKAFLDLWQVSALRPKPVLVGMVVSWDGVVGRGYERVNERSGVIRWAVAPAGVHTFDRVWVALG